MSYKFNRNQNEFNSIYYNLQYTPEIIRIPYFQLITLLENDEIYGALLKIKDIFELNIKLPLVILLSYISYKTSNPDNKTDFKTEFLALHNTLQEFTKDTISYQLSLGNWQTIAGAIKKIPTEQLFSNVKHKELLKVLYEINKSNHYAYISQRSKGKSISIANWRNETIGHGALNCDKEEVKKDILEKLDILNKILESNDVFFKNIKIDISDSNLIIKYNNVSTSIKISPFVELVDKNQFSIFESYNTKKKLSHSINYSNGNKTTSQKLSTNLSKIDASVQECSRISDTTHQFNHSICGSTIFSKDIKALMSADHYVYSQGNYFSNWFIECINTYPGGVFLCCAERGMGKSAFSRAVNQLSNIKIKNNPELSQFRDNNPEVIIRSFNFNSYFNSNLITFITKIKELFTTEPIIGDNNKPCTQSITYSSIDIELAIDNLKYAIFAETPNHLDIKEKFITLLKTILTIWQDEYGKEKLILVLDGIDEIKYGKNNIKISDIIPTATEMSYMELNDIYIFLTSRCSEELYNNTTIGNFIHPHKFTDFLELKREINSNSPSSPYSSCYLKEIKSHFAISDDVHAINLAKTLEWRYNYLTAYKKVYALHSAKNLNDFIKDPFDVYIDHLDFICKDYSNDIQSILNLLVITNEPLTINEISYLLTGDNNPTFKLYGQITDIQNFLNIERHVNRGTLYNLSHEEWVEKIYDNKRLETNRQQLKLHLSNLLTHILTNYETTNFNDTEFDGETWLLANFNEIPFNQTKLLKKVSKTSFGTKRYQFNRRKLFQENYEKLNRPKPNSLVLKEATNPHTDSYELVEKKSGILPFLGTATIAGLKATLSTTAGLGAILTKGTAIGLGSALGAGTVAGTALLGPMAILGLGATYAAKKILGKKSSKDETPTSNPFFNYLLNDNSDDLCLDELESYPQSPIKETQENIKYQLNNTVECIEASIDDGDIKEAYNYVSELLTSYEYYKDDYDYCCHYIFRGTEYFLKSIKDDKVSYLHKAVFKSLVDITNKEVARIAKYKYVDNNLSDSAKLNIGVYQSYLQNKCSKIISFHKPQEALQYCQNSIDIIKDIISIVDKQSDNNYIHYHAFVHKLLIEHNYNLNNIKFILAKQKY